VTRVYVDPGTAMLETGGSLDEEAVRSLRFLIDAGHEVVVVQGDDETPAELASLARDVVREVPPRPDAPAWYLTDDVERCQGRSARLRTVLIGAAPPTGSVHRCDAVARSVQAAVMEILAAEAMSAADPPSPT
jgi:hypothetical protein